MDYDQFCSECRELVRGESSHGTDYLNAHSQRLYVTYRLLADRVSSGDSVLSLGPGPCFVEVQLVEQLSGDLTVVEHPRNAERNRSIYQRYGIDCHAVDLAEAELDEISDRFDWVLACEVMEHLPLTAEEFLGRIATILKPGGLVLLSTPNVTSLQNLHRLARGQNIYEDDEEMFNSGGHGYEPHIREYTPAEVQHALVEQRFQCESVRFCENRRLSEQFSRNVTAPNIRALLIIAYLIAVRLIPRFRRTVIMVGKATDTS